MLRARAFLRRLRDERRGSVLTEFAVWSSSLFIVIMIGLDFGGYYLARGGINEAISAAAVKSFQTREAVAFNDLPGYVRNLAQNQSLAVTVSCNGTAGSCTNTSRTCACLKGDATYVASACGATCTGAGMTANSVGGYYLTVRAQASYTPLMLPRSAMPATGMAQATTVRLQ